MRCQASLLPERKPGARPPLHEPFENARRNGPMNRCSGDQSVMVRIPVHREHSFRFNVNTDSADAEQRFRLI